MPNSRIVGWTVVIRTRIIDDFILSAIGEGVDTVLNLGAGLDTRPYRMNLPASLHWIEADYPHLIEYKESQLAHETPRCHLERVEIDLADRPARQKLFSRVNAQANRILVLTEGRCSLSERRGSGAAGRRPPRHGSCPLLAGG